MPQGPSFASTFPHSAPNPIGSARQAAAISDRHRRPSTAPISGAASFGSTSASLSPSEPSVTFCPCATARASCAACTPLICG